MADAGAGTMTRPRDFLADRLRMILDDSPLTVSIMLFNAAILAFVHRGVIDGVYLGLWLGYMALIGAGRVMLLAAYRRRRPRIDRESAPWLRRTLAGVFASGVGWGVGGVVLIALGSGSHQVFTAFVLGGMAAGALPTLSRIFPVYAVFLVPTLVPVIGYFAVLGTEVSLFLTAMGLVFLGFLVVAGRRQQATVLGALRVADENRSLVEHLTAQRQEALQEKERVDRLNAELRREIADRLRTEEALRAAKVAAEAASTAKSQFLANMSHELRTPLNAIIGYSEILHEDALAHGQADGAADLERINRAGRHLLALINEVLDLARIESGRTEFHIETFPVRSVVADAADTVEPAVHANDSRLVIDCDDGVGDMTGDATKLRQVLANLLSNAAKFTENGEVRIEVRRGGDGRVPAEGRPEWILFRIADTGIGIAGEKLDSIFEAFERADEGRDPKYGGTGLGLAICRHYCELMGGAISVESTVGRGTEFLVRLPVSWDGDGAAATAAG